MVVQGGVKRAPERRVVHASAPVRICDMGGWTDTWFAGRGSVFHIAVRPGVEVEVRTAGPARRQGRVLSLPASRTHALPTDESAWEPLDAHPLLAATVEEAGLSATGLDIVVRSAVPAGSALGTSASVTVALLGALSLLQGMAVTPDDIARRAHLVETERLGLQSGVQDQVCAAHGGINLLSIDYPRATLSPLAVPPSTLWDLERRLSVVYLGSPHRSSEVHETVIARLEGDADATEALLAPLRAAAECSARALSGGDLSAFGEAMTANTAAQANLHPDLVGSQASAVIGLAGRLGASGWKVNGAGGEGGSVTVLTGASLEQKSEFDRSVRQIDATLEVLPVQISHDGLRVWETPRPAVR